MTNTIMNCSSLMTCTSCSTSYPLTARIGNLKTTSTSSWITCTVLYSNAAVTFINNYAVKVQQRRSVSAEPLQSSIGAADSLTRGTNPRMTDGAQPETSAFIRLHYPPAADPDRPDFYRTVLDLVISFSKTNGWRYREGGGGRGSRGRGLIVCNPGVIITYDPFSICPNTCWLLLSAPPRLHLPVKRFDAAEWDLILCDALYSSNKHHPQLTKV